MANKKDQHIVPKCYLRQFIDSSQTKEGKEQFEAGLFVNTSALDGPWRMRGLDHRTFTETRFYNLKSDDLEKPVIEDYMSVVESYYAKSIEKLRNYEFSSEIFSIITVFVIIQFFRSKRFLQNDQKSWDNISEIADMLEGGERNRILFGEVSKQTILHLANLSILKEIHRSAVIIINTSKIPFLTSDSPVIKRAYNRNDVTRIFYPLDQVTYSNEHIETPFYFMPLTPWLAYLSHNSFENKTKGFVCQYKYVISQLNDMTLLNADKHIYSFIKDPVTSLPPQKNQVGNSNYFKVKIFTDSKRVTLEVKDYQRDHDLLILDFIDVCAELVEGQQIVSVEVFDPNVSEIVPVTLKRGCGIKSINRLSNQIVFESNIH